MYVCFLVCFEYGLLVPEGVLQTHLFIDPIFSNQLYLFKCLLYPYKFRVGLNIKRAELGASSYC